MAIYIFPSSSTEGENYFIQFDIYDLKSPLKDKSSERLLSTTDNDKVQSVDLSKTLEKNIEGFSKGQTVDLESIKNSLTDLQSTFNYEVSANEILHSIKLPLQISPTEITAGSYGDESTRDVRTISKILSGKTGDISGVVSRRNSGCYW